MATYSQSTGKFTTSDGTSYNGYSGNGDGLNNSDKESEAFVGPIPKGSEFCLTYQPEYAKTLETWGPLTVNNYDTTKNVHLIIPSAAADCPLHISSML
ncbi:unnamed protein product [Rotaria sordida]|uniref:Uncharacterized protein n=1 Tax=Rotaria sordida TaxID=392033 RepID=A0A818QZH5_9BILA|nr:unnamed protein product [Rotaria sordida]CAF3641880.1 unnamed protein product [Rotaria sordida]